MHVVDLGVINRLISELLVRIHVLRSAHRLRGRRVVWIVLHLLSRVVLVILLVILIMRNRKT